MATPTLTANSPSPGYISWTAFHITYLGTTYSVGAANTNAIYTAWLYNNGSPLLVTSNTPPTESGTADATSADWSGSAPFLGPDDLLLFVNKNGVPINVQAAQMVDGDLLVSGTVTSAQIATGTIVANNIASGTITGSLMAANTILAANIAAGAIGTNAIAAGAITAGTIAAGAIDGKTITGATFSTTLAAGSVAERLTMDNAGLRYTTDASSNVLWNGDFYWGITDWELWNGTGNTPVFGTANLNAYRNDGGLGNVGALTMSGRNMTLQDTDTGANEIYARQFYWVKPSTTYTFSVYMMVGDGSYSSIVKEAYNRRMIGLVDATAGTSAFYTYASDHSDLSFSGFRRYTVTLTTGATTNSIEMRLYPITADNSSAGGRKASVYDALQLEEKSYATAYMDGTTPGATWVNWANQSGWTGYTSLNDTTAVTASGWAVTTAGTIGTAPTIAPTSVVPSNTGTFQNKELWIPPDIWPSYRAVLNYTSAANASATRQGFTFRLGGGNGFGLQANSWYTALIYLYNGGSTVQSVRCEWWQDTSATNAQGLTVQLQPGWRIVQIPFKTGATLPAAPSLLGYIAVTQTTPTAAMTIYVGGAGIPAANYVSTYTLVGNDYPNPWASQYPSDTGLIAGRSTRANAAVRASEISGGLNTFSGKIVGSNIKGSYISGANLIGAAIVGANILTKATGNRVELVAGGGTTFTTYRRETFSSTDPAAINYWGEDDMLASMYTPANIYHGQTGQTSLQIDTWDASGASGGRMSSQASGAIVVNAATTTFQAAAAGTASVSSDLLQCDTFSGRSSGINCTGAITFKYTTNLNNCPTWVHQDVTSHRMFVIQSLASNTSKYLDCNTNTGAVVACITSSGNVQGTGAYTALSDGLAKQQIKYTKRNGALDKIKELKPAKFQYIDSDEVHHGFIAQDVQPVIPEAVVTFGEGHDERDRADMLGVDDASLHEPTALGLRMDPIIAHLVLAVQDLAERIGA